MITQYLHRAKQAIRRTAHICGLAALVAASSLSLGGCGRENSATSITANFQAELENPGYFSDDIAHRITNIYARLLLNEDRRRKEKALPERNTNSWKENIFVLSKYSKEPIDSSGNFLTYVRINYMPPFSLRSNQTERAINFNYYRTYAKDSLNSYERFVWIKANIENIKNSAELDYVLQNPPIPQTENVRLPAEEITDKERLNEEKERIANILTILEKKIDYISFTNLWTEPVIK